MKNLSVKAKIFFALQILFTVLTFVGAILLFIGKFYNAGMSICCMAISLAFANLYKSAKNEK